MKIQKSKETSKLIVYFYKYGVLAFSIFMMFQLRRTNIAYYEIFCVLSIIFFGYCIVFTLFMQNVKIEDGNVFVKYFIKWYKISPGTLRVAKELDYTIFFQFKLVKFITANKFVKYGIWYSLLGSDKEIYEEAFNLTAGEE